MQWLNLRKLEFEFEFKNSNSLAKFVIIGLQYVSHTPFTFTQLTTI